jgi:hypothetical protein
MVGVGGFYDSVKGAFDPAGGMTSFFLTTSTDDDPIFEGLVEPGHSFFLLNRSRKGNYGGSI